MSSAPIPHGTQTPQPMVGDGILAGALTAVAVTGAVYWAGWHVMPGLPDWAGMPAWRMLGGWATDLAGIHYPLIPTQPVGQGYPWSVIEQAARQQGLSWITPWTWLARVSAGLGIAAGAWVGWLASRPAPAIVRQAGRETTRRAKDVATEIRQEGQPDGVRLHPDLPISQARERQHLLALGQSGAGKTQILLPIMQQAISRGDRALVFDYKGDLTERLDGSLLAPWDARSLAWDIAMDCRNKQAARAMAEAMIRESSDPMWSNGARQILVAMLVSLQRERGTDWTWADLAEKTPKSFKELQNLVEKYNPEGQAAAEEPNKTVLGLRITLSTYLAPVFDLADAWGRHPANRRLSLVDWITNPDGGPKTLILQGNLEMPSLQRAYLQGVFRTLMSMVGSPRFPAEDHRIWMFLDEFLQIGKIDQLLPLLEVARGKGVRLILAAQDISRIRDIYGQDQASALSGVIGTMVMGRTIGESAQWCSDLLGDQRISRYTSSVSSPMGIGAAGQRTTSYTVETIPCMRPDEFGQLGQVTVAGKPASRALLYMGGQRAAILDWPRVALPTQRPAHHPADWTAPDWPHALEAAMAQIEGETGEVPAGTGETPDFAGASQAAESASTDQQASPPEAPSTSSQDRITITPLVGAGTRAQQMAGHEVADEASDPMQDAVLTIMVEHTAGGGAAHALELLHGVLDAVDETQTSGAPAGIGAPVVVEQQAPTTPQRPRWQRRRTSDHDHDHDHEQEG
ncbi:type IV secretion system DNA-binding domain-containing protein [Thermithiobacillus plumbiphilus]|uniref:Type IV secretion system DNA-binding domain-containing protein n=1 Tax=Thermithiobacillus plumbiphilus TaxID=1729899 RepID=A0ABU9D8H8_9PROT